MFTGRRSISDGQRKKYGLFVDNYGCVNYGLKHLAEANKDEYPLGSQFIMNNFHVDDGVTSIQTTKDAIQLAQEAHDLCAIGGLRLHKFVSNSNAVLESIPPQNEQSI